MKDLLSISGYVLIGIFVFQIVLGSRQILKKFVTDFYHVNTIHKYVGILSIIALCMHPIAAMFDREESYMWIFTPYIDVTSEMYITLGRAALIVGLIVWITSALARKKLSWKVWKLLHITAYPAFLLSWIHMYMIGSYFKEYPSIRYAMWLVLGAVILAVALRVRAWAGFGKSLYRVKSIDTSSPGVIQLTMSYLSGARIASQMGQYVYIQLGALTREHPFSIMENHNDGEELVFGLRNSGPFSVKILAGEITDVYVDGPFGNFTHEIVTDAPFVSIIGGIGITPLKDRLLTYGKNATLIYCNRTHKEAFQIDVLRSKVAHMYEVHPQEGEGGHVGDACVLTQESIVMWVADYKMQKYYVCGSPSFVDAAVSLLGTLNVPIENIHRENLGY